MNARQITAEYRLAGWAPIVRGKRDVGQTVDEYCAQCGVAPRAFYYWQKKLREAILAGTFLAKEQKRETGLTPQGWSAAEIAGPEPVASPAQTLAVEIGACRALAGRDADAELLAKVCKVLASLC
jgi:hypothetical protein